MSDIPIVKKLPKDTTPELLDHTIMVQKELKTLNSNFVSNPLLETNIPNTVETISDVLKLNTFIQKNNNLELKNLNNSIKLIGFNIPDITIPEIETPNINNQILPTPINNTLLPTPINNQILPTPINNTLLPTPINNTLLPTPINNNFMSPNIPAPIINVTPNIPAPIATNNFLPQPIEMPTIDVMPFNNEKEFKGSLNKNSILPIDPGAVFLNEQQEKRDEEDKKKKGGLLKGFLGKGLGAVGGILSGLAGLIAPVVLFGTLITDFLGEGGALELFKKGEFGKGTATLLFGKDLSEGDIKSILLGLGKQALKWGSLGFMIAGPIGGLIGLGLGAAGGAIKLGYDSGFFDKLYDTSKDAFAPIIDLVGEITGNIRTSIERNPKLKEFLDLGADSISKPFLPFIEFFKGGPDEVEPLIKDKEAFKAKFQETFDSIFNSFSEIGNASKEFFTNTKDKIKTFIDESPLFQSIKNLIEKPGQIIENIMSSITSFFENIKSFFSFFSEKSIGNIIKDLTKGLSFGEQFELQKTQEKTASLLSPVLSDKSINKFTDLLREQTIALSKDKKEIDMTAVQSSLNMLPDMIKQLQSKGLSEKDATSQALEKLTQTIQKTAKPEGTIEIKQYHNGGIAKNEQLALLKRNEEVLSPAESAMYRQRGSMFDKEVAGGMTEVQNIKVELKREDDKNQKATLGALNKLIAILEKKPMGNVIQNNSGGNKFANPDFLNSAIMETP